MKSRKEQIDEATKEFYLKVFRTTPPDNTYPAFKAGAEWADSNPEHLPRLKQIDDALIEKNKWKSIAAELMEDVLYNVNAKIEYPKRITHDELIESCDEAVGLYYEALTKYREAVKDE